MTTTNINTNTNTNTNININTIAESAIVNIMTSLEREDGGRHPISRGTIIQLTLEKMGLEVREAYVREFSDVWVDKIINFDWETGHELTFVGDMLVVAHRCYDFRDRYEDIKPGRDPLPGEKVVTWGNPSYAYVGVLTASAVSDEVAETWHKYAWSVVDQVKASVEAERAKLRKGFGETKNKALKEAGCTQDEVTAWWSMSWKKEVSPNFWANLCHTCSTEQVEWALEAHSNRYLESIDMHLGSSFPRSMDIIHALAKAKGITKGRKLPKKHTMVDIPPTRVCKDGSMEWSF